MGYWLMFGAGVLAGAALAVTLLCALIMAGDDDERAAELRGGGWQ